MSTSRKLKENWKNIIIALDGISTDEFFRHFMCSRLRRKITFTYLNDEFKKFYVNSVKGCEGLAEYRVYAKIRISDDEQDEQDELVEDLDAIVAEIEEQEIEESDTVEAESKMTAVTFTTMLANYAKTYAYIRNRKFSNQKINNAIFVGEYLSLLFAKI